MFILSSLIEISNRVWIIILGVCLFQNMNMSLLFNSPTPKKYILFLKDLSFFNCVVRKFVYLFSGERKIWSISR